MQIRHERAAASRIAPNDAGTADKHYTAIVVALIGLIGVVVSAIVGASWFTPDLLRLDVLFPTKEVQILDDFVFVHFEGYREHGSSSPIETYTNPYTSSREAIYDKSTNVEHVWLRKTTGNYAIRLSTSGIPPEIRAISPPIKEPRFEETPSGNKIMTAELSLDQSPEFKWSGRTPNPKTIYVYRNGYQQRNSAGGKNVAYATDRLTFVYDFSALAKWDSLFRIAPKACLRRTQDERPVPLDLKWEKGVAIVEAFTLKNGDKVRIFWTWNRAKSNDSPYQEVTCDEALR